MKRNCIEPGSIGNKTFTAQWQGINYTITYILKWWRKNGEGNPATYMKDTATFKLSSQIGKGINSKVGLVKNWALERQTNQ